MFHCFNDFNRFSVWYIRKRLNLCLWKIAMLQIKKRDKTMIIRLGFQRPILELKHIFILCFIVYETYIFIVWSFVHNFFQFDAMINCWMKWNRQILVRNKCIAFCVFRTQILINTCLQLKAETLYWNSDCGQSQQ